MPLTSDFVSGCCIGEYCFCGARAAAKVEEVIFKDDPRPMRRPLAAFVCRSHFAHIMGKLDPWPGRLMLTALGSFVLGASAATGIMALLMLHPLIAALNGGLALAQGALLAWRMHKGIA